jgi:glycosyltransferase involved in cell wall biosynthesis
MQPTPRPLRLLVLTHSYWPEHSPPQRRWSSLTRYLRHTGWDVSFLAPVPRFRGTEPGTDTSGHGRPTCTGPLGETIHRVPFLSARHNRGWKLADQMFTAAASAVRGMGTGEHDLVLVTAPSLPLLASGWALARAKKVPFVVEMRDAWPNLAEDANLVRGGGKSMINQVVEFVQNHADLVVTVTEGFAETLRERGVRNVVTIRNGVILARTPRLLPPPVERERLEVLYLGNHGESQSLERLVEAAALVGDRMRLTLVGQGSRKPALEALAARLRAPVRFLPPEYGSAVFERYAEADSVVISLRDDWKSFEDTIPSKTYEVLSVGRHITAIVRGEAARVLDDAGEGSVVGSRPEEIAALWQGLIADRSRLRQRSTGRAWVAANADYRDLAASYDAVLRTLLPGIAVPVREELELAELEFADLEVAGVRRARAAARVNHHAA